MPRYKVEYKTLVALTRSNPKLCRLAHRQALSNLRAYRVDVSPDNAFTQSGRAEHVRIRSWTLNAQIVEALKYVERPISKLELTTSEIPDGNLLRTLLHQRTDFAFTLNIRPRRETTLSSKAFHALANSRIKHLSLSNIDLDDGYKMPPGTKFHSLMLTKVSPSVLRALATIDVEKIFFYNIRAIPFDSTTIPASCRALVFTGCEFQGDLSHCLQLEQVYFGADRENDFQLADEVLLKILATNSLKRVYVRRPGVRFSASQEVKNAYRNRGVELRLQ